MSVEQLNHIDAEGGPLLLLDATLAAIWKGTSGDGADYERACNIFDGAPGLEGGPISIDKGTGILWEMEGAGTAYVFKETDSHFILVRAWPSNPDDAGVFLGMAKEPRQQLSNLGTLTVESGFLLIIWAAEDGSCVKSLENTAQSRPKGDMAIANSGLLVKVGNKSFQCFHDRIDTKSGMARRLHLLANEK